MTQPSKARRERRRQHYQTMLLEARMLGCTALWLEVNRRTTPNSHNLRELSELIADLRRKK
jgi:hypothetical protein